MVKLEIKKYLQENLGLEIEEQSFGLNGSHLSIKLTLEGEVISEDYIDIKSDDG